MTHLDSHELAGTTEPWAYPAVTTKCVSGRRDCGLRLLSPIDPLTRLLMKADGVTEAYLTALMRKIAAIRE